MIKNCIPLLLILILLSADEPRISLYRQFLYGPPVHARYDVLRTDRSGPFIRGEIFQRLYKNAVMDRSLLEFMGFNSIQPFCPVDKAMAALGHEDLYKETGFADIGEFEQYLVSLKGTPVILAFSDISSSRQPFKLLEKQGVWQKETLLESADIHTAFCPYRIDSEQGWKYLRGMYEAVAETAEKNNVNVLAYQVLNEIDYSDISPEAQKKFQDWCIKKFGSAEKAQKAAGTDFDISSVKLPSPYREGLRGLYREFMEENFAEQIKKIVTAVKTADKRPGIHFSVEYNNGAFYNQNSGANYWKLVNYGGLDLLNGEYLLPSFGSSSISSENIDPMFAGLMQGPVEPYFYLEALKGAGDRKLPLVDTEQSLKRYRNNVQVPVRPEDVITRLWNNIFCGISSVYFYSWESSPAWKKPYTLQTAEEMVRNLDYTGASWLNPFVFPEETVAAVRIFRDELAAVEKDLPGSWGWGTPEVFIIFSKATLCQEPDQYQFKERMIQSVQAMQKTGIPWGIIWEESLACGRIPGSAKIIIASAATHIEDRAFVNLKAWTEKGGQIILCAESLQYNQYSAKRSDAILPGLDSGREYHNLKLSDDLLLPYFKSAFMPSGSGDAVMVKKTCAQGALVFTADPAPGQAALLEALLKNAVEKLISSKWKVTTDKGKRFSDVVLRAMGDEKKLFLYVCSMANDAQNARITVNLPSGNYRIIEARTCREYTAGKSKFWSSEALADGFSVVLPSQEALIFRIQPENTFKEPVKTGQEKSPVQELAFYREREAKYRVQEEKIINQVNRIFNLPGEISASVDIIKNGQPADDCSIFSSEWGEYEGEKALIFPIPAGSQNFLAAPLKLKKNIELSPDYADQGYIEMELSSLAPEGIIPPFDFHIKIGSETGAVRWMFSGFYLDGGRKTWQKAAVKLSEYQSVSGKKMSNEDFIRAINGINEVVLQFRKISRFGIAVKNLRFVLIK